jgi:hypothetical protein
MNVLLLSIKRWVVLLSIIGPLSVFSQIDEVKMDFDTLRAGGHSVHDYHFNVGNEWQVLKFIKQYENDPHEGVRSYVRMIRAKLARQTADTVLRQQVIESFAEDCLLPYGDISQYVTGRLQLYHERDFSPRAKQLLMTVYKKGNYEGRFLLVCGIAQVKELIPQLKKQAATFDRTKDWPGTVGWYASLALARMGASENIDAIICAVELELRKTYRVGTLLQYIAYTRHPDCIKLMRKYLESSERLPGEKRPDDGMACNRYALHYLARYMDNFPVKYDDAISYSAEQMETARAYFKNKDEENGR